MGWGGSEHQRAVEAIERQLIANLEYAKDPFVALARQEDFDSADYTEFIGDYADEGQGEVTHRFRIEVDGFTWTYREQDPMIFYAANSHQLVREDAEMTIEFLVDESGKVTGVEERWERRRKTVPVATAHRAESASES